MRYARREVSDSATTYSDSAVVCRNDDIFRLLQRRFLSAGNVAVLYLSGSGNLL